MWRLFSSLDGVCTMTLENTGQSEFTEAVTNHIFRGIDAHEILAIVDEEGVADEIGRDHGGASPGLDGALAAFRLIHLVHLIEEGLLNEGAFFQGTCHKKIR